MQVTMSSFLEEYPMIFIIIHIVMHALQYETHTSKN